MEGKSYQIWYNEPVPVPAETYSECYAPEFMTSYLKSLAGDVLPAFSPLICQDDYKIVRFVTTTPVINTGAPLQAYAHPVDGFDMVPAGITAPRQSEVEPTPAGRMSSTADEPTPSTRAKASEYNEESTSQEIQHTAERSTYASPTSSASATSTDSGDNSIPTKKWIVIGVVVGTSVLITIIMFVWKFQKRRSKGNKASAGMELGERQSLGTSTVAPLRQNATDTSPVNSWVHAQNQRSGASDLSDA
ncbi:MAG: hypothetical protein Q9166_001026 [cf. Caloplaca sp. 2 TL-2023]